MYFLDAPRFPTDINYKLVREVNYSTDIVQNKAGVSRANAVMTQPKHRYDVSYAGKDKANMQKLLCFFHSVRGRLHSFRFKDNFDCSSSNSPDTAITANSHVFFL